MCTLFLTDQRMSTKARIEFNFVLEPAARSRSSSLKRHQTPQPLSAAPEKHTSTRSASVGPESGAVSGNRASGNFTRTDSYENFDRPEGKILGEVADFLMVSMRMSCLNQMDYVGGSVSF